ncbi:FabD/lysophospholipase-like protein [Pseudovirgaria hyperparasitica]|uniref:Lysophospholipase n=1 Tax=Pseudovirgaria hyperparasitica TaxID=470096 RepID=A0A6A6WFJ4_9PEZI|nr:FabD/lysophospholipase-like protein [Pseudovirgaria hyperparasitica]KAF2760666.1 FabD/lysophospholipase-like protein [Pseudovirgaria hyperparasitica]
MHRPHAVPAHRRIGFAARQYSTRTAHRHPEARPTHLSSAAHATAVAAAAGLLLYGQSHGHFEKVGVYFHQSQRKCDSSDRFSRWGREAPIIERSKDQRRKQTSTDAPAACVDGSGAQSPPSQTQRSEDSEGKRPWIDFESIGDKITNLLVPDWVKLLPEFITKLQNELSMAPGSLAEQIWWEAHDPESNPEIIWDAAVRVSNEICPQEKNFLDNRRHFTRKALASYLDLKEEDIHPNDIPVIAMCGSGGGLRALVAGASSYLSAQEAGLFDCVTYSAGVSGSCWMQALFYSSITGQNHQNLIRHLKSRLGVHIAFPPTALSLLNSAPTNKYLLGGLVEKLKGTPDAEFGLVDVYGLLLAARLLVPKGELAVHDADLKVSNQRRYTDGGKFPMPIYTAVRHEIPFQEQNETSVEAAKERAKREAWFQWFEITPYEFWCEEYEAGIPTWAMGRKFENGKTVWQNNGMVLPETRVPIMMGIWGSAFCATLSHYYKEIRPIVKSLSGFGGIDQLIAERDDDLVKIHPIDPATIPNFALGMQGALPTSVPKDVFESKYLELMDAGMSNNLPIYPLLRPGREVDIIIAFDASADVREDNWLKVVDGYARQRGIKGWPIGAGWPTVGETKEQINQEFESAQANTEADAQQKLAKAQDSDDKDSRPSANVEKDLGFCNVWIGTTEERTSADIPPTSHVVEEDWQLMTPNAGITVVYNPFVPNPSVPGINPSTSDFMSTWNFVYSPEEIESVVQLAKANFEEGAERTKRTVRAVYERKKKLRLETEKVTREARRRAKVRRGEGGKKLGQGDHADHFS